MMSLKIVEDNGRFICSVNKDMRMNQVNLHRGVKKKSVLLHESCFDAINQFILTRMIFGICKRTMSPLPHL